MSGNYIDLGNPVADHPLNNGLVAWWFPLPNNRGGSRLFDLRGRFNGTLTNDPIWETGYHPFSAGVTFAHASTTQHVATGVTANTYLGDTAGFILCGFAVVRIPSTARTVNGPVISKRSLGTEGWGCYVMSSGLVQLNWVNNASVGAFLASASTVPTDEWFTIGWRIGGTGAGTNFHAIWINGVLNASSSPSGYTPLASTSPVVIGGEPANTRGLGGTVESIKLFKVTGGVSSVRFGAMHNEWLQGYPNTLRRWSTRARLFGTAPGGTTHDVFASGGAALSGTVPLTIGCVASGGDTIAGTASLALALAAADGTVLSASADSTTVYAPAASGGLATAGTPTLAASYPFNGTGGATASGTALPELGVTASGGLVGGGVASLSTSVTTFGETVTGGFATPAVAYLVVPSAGATIAGSATPVVVWVPVASGLALIAGAVVDVVGYTPTATGAVVLDGLAAASVNLAALGGLLGAGSAVSVATYPFTATGGVVATDTGVVSTVWSPSSFGGGVASDTAGVALVYVFAASGPILLAGQAGVDGQVFTVAGAGGLTTDGTSPLVIRVAEPTGGPSLIGDATAGSDLVWVPVGPTTLSGTAGLTNVWSPFATGGLASSGAGTVMTTHPVFPSGGALLAGAAAYGLVSPIAATGGASLAGTRTEMLVLGWVPIGGLGLGGLATVALNQFVVATGGVFVSGLCGDVLVRTSGQRRTQTLIARQHSQQGLVIRRPAGQVLVTHQGSGQTLIVRQ